jgi:nitroreductase
MMDEVLRAIFERRSIRKYSAEPVKREDVELVLQAGLYASRGTSACLPTRR